MRTSDGGAEVVGLEHVSYPFTRVLAPSSERNVEAFAQDVGNDYLQHVATVVGIGDGVLRALRQDDVPGFGWLAITWGNGTAPATRNANGSFVVARETAAGKPLDRTLVLLAGYRLSNKSGSAGEVGLSVIMHIAEGDRNRLEFRVTGLTTSNLPAELKRAFPFPKNTLNQQMLLLLSRLQTYHQAEEISVQGIAPAVSGRRTMLRIFGNGRKASGRVFAFVNQTSNLGVAFESLALLDLESGATGPAGVPKAFVVDPQSRGAQHAFEDRRPTRTDKVLEPFRVKTQRLTPMLQRVGVLEVRQTRIGRCDDAPDPHKPQSIDLQQLPLRSDALSAAHAFLRGDEFMERFVAYGLPPTTYFKVAKLPLVLRHRAPIRGALDGDTINAQVRPSNVSASLAEAPAKDCDPRPQVEVSFAAANRRRRGRVQVLPAMRWRLQPVGLAADRRWAWHEFSHVLNYASFGKLEFRFAHSAGDALAAIVTDPDSALAEKGLANGPFERHITFPWVAIGRRHDRDPASGWSCCGRRNIARLASSTAFDDTRRGYFEEQLLSSALFRFYRVIGGDCAVEALRRSASDYSVFLIFRAIQLMGQTTAPIRTIDGFAASLMQADTGTQKWNVVATWPENSAPRNLYRVGGCVHKALRWAFERQGLYATHDPLAIVEGVGQPPAVDIFIANSRPAEDGKPPTATGDYWPVPLNWSAADELWHASDKGIALRAGRIIVTVRNRGTAMAKNVLVGCWLWPAMAGPTPTLAPLWPTVPSQPQDVAPGAAVEFQFDPGVHPAGNTRHFVLAAATCDSDRSNADPASGQPCSTLGAPLIDLVANDNNMGLRVLLL